MKTPEHPVFTRRDMCREEINTAIDLVLTDGSMIGANLLAWAAIDVLRGVAKAEGKQTLGDAILEMIKPDHHTDWFYALKEHYNFAKHADRDPDKTMALDPEIVYHAVFHAVIDYGTIFGKLTLPMLMFRSWMFARSPDVLTDQGAQQLKIAERLFGKTPTVEAAMTIYTTYKENRHRFYRGLQPEARDAFEAD